MLLQTKSQAAAERDQAKQVLLLEFESHTSAASLQNLGTCSDTCSPRRQVDSAQKDGARAHVCCLWWSWQRSAVHHGKEQPCLPHAVASCIGPRKSAPQTILTGKSTTLQVKRQTHLLKHANLATQTLKIITIIKDFKMFLTDFNPRKAKFCQIFYS